MDAATTPVHDEAWAIRALTSLSDPAHVVHAIKPVADAVRAEADVARARARVASLADNTDMRDRAVGIRDRALQRAALVVARANEALLGVGLEKAMQRTRARVQRLEEARTAGGAADPVIAAVGLVSARASAVGAVGEEAPEVLACVDPAYRALAAQLVELLGFNGAVAELRRRAVARDAAFMEMADADTARYAAQHVAYERMSRQERAAFVGREITGTTSLPAGLS
jgi:hypothetical protein